MSQVHKPRGSSRREANVLFLLAGLCVLAAVLVACGMRFLDWFGQRQIEKIDIVLTGVDAVLKPPLDLSLELACELRNANPSWVDLATLDYCVEVNELEVHCGKYPEKDQKVRVASGETVETRVKVVPTADSAGRLLESLLKAPGIPQAVITGTAHVDSPVGSLDFKVRTRPVRFELRRVGFHLDLPAARQEGSAP